MKLSDCALAMESLHVSSFSLSHTHTDTAWTRDASRCPWDRTQCPRLYADVFVGYIYNNLLTKLLEINSLVCTLCFTQKGRMSWPIKEVSSCIHNSEFHNGAKIIQITQSPQKTSYQGAPLYQSHLYSCLLLFKSLVTKGKFISP